EEDQGRPPLGLAFPNDLDFYDHPTPVSRFKELLIQFKRATSRTYGWHSKRIVLLIDEFSYLYGLIVQNRLPDEEFMKIWKSLLQDELFSAVLAGQDVMPKFKERFPNEFGIVQDQRVSYLKSEDAVLLIDEPIRIGGKTGKSRYREKAIERIVDLTAGSPFYIQIICHRLVEYMNRKRTSLVTEADVEQVKNELITGANLLGWDKFDNLISSGDTSPDAISSEEAKVILKIIARNYRTGCNRNNIVEDPTITDNPQIDVDKILEDLEKREVIEVKSGQYYTIRVGLFRDWLLAH
ncbi:MAG TPA: hypothetical protein VKX46_00300, partial [Ktedonobacteraceae bacterium]|nr:hypothetical protein [Ktedonobacteraceae bacterium]